MHVLARGGRIVHYRDEDSGRIHEIDCFTREGWRLSTCTLEVFGALKRKRLISSKDGQPYRITRDGLKSLRSQADNR